MVTKKEEESYNAAGLPSLASSDLGFTTAYAYNDALVLTNETISGLDAPDSVFEIGRTVDSRQRPSVMSLTHDGTNVTQVTYGYDSEDRRAHFRFIDLTAESALLSGTGGGRSLPFVAQP